MDVDKTTEVHQVAEEATAAAVALAVAEWVEMRVQHAQAAWPTTTIWLPEVPPVNTEITVFNTQYYIISIKGRPIFEAGNPNPVRIDYTLIVTDVP